MSPIKMRCTPADSNPHMDADNGTMSHWRCTITHQGRRMTVIFSMGQAHCGREPSIKEVVSCLVSDASGIDSADNCFEHWCSEYGYDTDSRKAERTYKATLRQTKALHRVLGSNYDRIAAKFQND